MALALFGLAFGVPQERPRSRRPRPGQRPRRPCQTPGLSSAGTTGCNDVRAEGAIEGLNFGGKKKRSAHEEIAANHYAEGQSWIEY